MFFKYIFLSLISLLISTNISADDPISQKYKEKKIYPMGKKIFDKMCLNGIEPSKYSNLDELRSEIVSKQLCKPLSKKHLDAVSIYLWDKKRTPHDISITYRIAVSKDDKCPICGMYVYKYPKWAAQIVHNDIRYSFDGVKDLMKYYFLKENEEKKQDKTVKILVTDYYSQDTIDAKKAFYVLGSDIYGPMGDEFIPFRDEDDAKTFFMDHRGTKVLKFGDITQNEVYKLDE